MRSRDFCFWLQGYFEIEKKQTGILTILNEDQVRCISDHLNLVFAHEIDPEAGDATVQKKLNDIHDKPGVSYSPFGAKVRC